MANAPSPTGITLSPYHLDLQKGRRWLLILGAAMLVIGTASIILPVAATMAVSLLVGWVLVVAGVAQLLHSFQTAKQGGGSFWSWIMAAVYLAGGLMVLINPLEGAVTITLVLAIYFIVGGVYRCMWAFKIKPLPGWHIMLLSGALDLILGLLVWSGLPGSAAWVLGLFLGIDLICGGWSVIMIYLALNKA